MWFCLLCEVVLAVILVVVLVVVVVVVVVVCIDSQNSNYWAKENTHF